MEKKFEGEDRRRYKRAEASFLVVFRINEPWEVVKYFRDKDLVAVMNDISEGGVSMFTNSDIPPSSMLTLKFTVINHSAVESERVTTIEARGSVRYKNMLDKGERRLGLEFVHIKDSDKAAIADFTNAALVS